MTTRRSFLAGAAALAAGTGAVPAEAAYPDAPYTATGTLGVAAPFTGDSMRLGEQIANGVRAAIDQANRVRGTFDRLMNMRTFDDEDLLASGIVTAGFACDDPNVLCVIGHLNGHITEQAARVYDNKGMPLIVPASTFDRLTEDGFGNLLRLPTKDSTEGQLSARYVSTTLKPAKVAAFYQDGDYGFDAVRGFAQQADTDKLPVQEYQFPYDKPKFADVAKAGLSGKPDVAYLAGNVADMGPLLHELRAAGFTGTIVASKGFFDATTTKKYAADLGAFIVATPLPPLNLAPSVNRIRADFELRYGAFTYLAAFGYAAAQIAMAAIRRAGVGDRLALMRQLQLPAPYDTIVGPYQFLPSGDAVDPNVYFYGIRDGAFHYERAAHPTSFILK
jgi:ABC-type branched-subunit amino acid transport system substrate-binding protein